MLDTKMASELLTMSITYTDVLGRYPPLPQIVIFRDMELCSLIRGMQSLGEPAVSDNLQGWKP
jgi:hypothetical protein